MSCATAQIAAMQRAVRFYDAAALKYENAVKALNPDHDRQNCAVCQAHGGYLRSNHQIAVDGARVELLDAAKLLRAQFGPLA